MVVSRYASSGVYNVNNTGSIDKLSSIGQDNNVHGNTAVNVADNTNVQSSDVKTEDGAADGKVSANRAPAHSNPSDFTFDFQKGKRFNLEGATKDYEDINVGMAISDMKKDTVLDKYKFFVDSPNLGTDVDGTVRIVKRQM